MDGQTNIFRYSAYFILFMADNRLRVPPRILSAIDDELAGRQATRVYLGYQRSSTTDIYIQKAETAKEMPAVKEEHERLWNQRMKKDSAQQRLITYP